MEDEVHYVAVTFKPTASTNADVKPEKVIYDRLKSEQQSPAATPEVMKDSEVIYDEVKTEERPQTHPNAPTASSEIRRKATVCRCMTLVAAGLGFICVALLSTIIALALQKNRLSSERQSETSRLTEDIEGLRTELSRLRTLTEDLRTERDGLNWTLSVIMKYNNFPVAAHCPQQECRPCLDGWLQFESSCYFFPDSGWNSWQSSRDFCRGRNSDLVTIQSQREQEFISKHTLQYHQDYSGYWIGFREINEAWAWVDGTEPNVSFWMKEQALYPGSCVLTFGSDPLFSWKKVSCTIVRRWICETPALVRTH